MGLNVDVFKKTAEFISNKVQSGGTVTASQFSLIANQAQLAVFERDWAQFVATGHSSDFMDWFLKNITVTPDMVTGYVPYPSDYQHTAGVRSYYNRKERPVEAVENKMWGEVQASQIMQPTKTFPKYTEFSTEFRFLPRDIGIVMLDYWKIPTVPVWGYTIVLNEQVYDPTTSVDFEWPEFAINQVLAVYLALIGVNLKDEVLEGFIQEFKKDTNIPS
jgi:hypothetical protein